MRKLEFPIMFHIIKTIRAILSNGRFAKEGSRLLHSLNIAFCKQIWSFMRTKFPEVIRRYSDIRESTNGTLEAKIWTCWWQGEDNAPPLIKICLDSIRRNAASHEVVVIDKGNINDYIDMPAHIMEKLDKGIIRVVSFTDILRMYLLTEYGGLWLDATVYMYKPIPEEILNMPVYTFKYYSTHFYRPDSIRGELNLAFADNIIGGHSGHPLFCFSRDMLTQYWAKYSSLIVYGVLFYMLQLAYDIIPLVKIDIDTIPINNNNRFKLREIFNDAFNQEEINSLINSDTYFFKLDWKKEYRMYTETGEETVYKRFLDNNLNP